MSTAQIVDSPETLDKHASVPTETLEGWVISKVNDWRDHYRTNYAEQHDEYYRLFRGIWKASDKTRSTERSKIISPAIQQAVESNIAEIEEATFGNGKFFDVVDDKNDPDAEDVASLRTLMHEDFAKLQTKQKIAEIILNAAVFGTGIGELVLDEIEESVPASQPGPNNTVLGGVQTTKRKVVKLIPVMPRHFLYDPAAENIEADQSLGCAVDKYVPTHTIEILQEKGVYRSTPIQTDITDTEREADQELTTAPKGQTRLTKYFGKVPRHLLEKAALDLKDDEIIVDLDTDTPKKDQSFYVEAVVIISDGTSLLKADENQNMMGDRNIVAFQWDKVPSRFQGRGVVEKGYNSQKALDAEIRARIDALGLTVHPMMGMDATRMPRGARPNIQPGKIVLTNGDPREVLHPFNFGQVQQITFPQAQALDAMVQKATGAEDMGPGSVNADQAASAMSQARSGIVKRHKRTQLNFEESFLIPFITKVAWRYMQFDPEKFPVRDLNFVVKGTLGIVAREYEVAQLVQLLQTLGDDAKIKPALMKAVVEHMNVSNREEVVAAIEAAAQPTEEEMEAAKKERESQLRLRDSQSSAQEALADESQARAGKLKAEMKEVPIKLENERLKIILGSLPEDAKEKEFNKRVEVAKLLIEEKGLGVKLNQPGENQ